MAPYLPLTAASAAAIAQDESVHTDIEPDMADRAPVIDVTAEETPSVTEPDATAEQAAPLDDLDALAWADLKDRAFAAGIPTKGKNRAALTEALRNHTPETES
jgi:hypothetical protein